MAFIHMDKDMLRYIRADDMNNTFAAYFKSDANEIIKQIYLDLLVHKLSDNISISALEYTDKPRRLGWTTKERRITLTKMPYNARHLITLQNFLLWAAKQYAKDETKDNNKRKRVRRKPQ